MIIKNHYNMLFLIFQYFITDSLHFFEKTYCNFAVHYNFSNRFNFVGGGFQFYMTKRAFIGISAKARF